MDRVNALWLMLAVAVGVAALVMWWIGRGSSFDLSAAIARTVLPAPPPRPAWVDVPPEAMEVFITAVLDELARRCRNLTPVEARALVNTAVQRTWGLLQIQGLCVDRAAALAALSAAVMRTAAERRYLFAGSAADAAFEAGVAALIGVFAPDAGDEATSSASTA